MRRRVGAIALALAVIAALAFRLNAGLGRDLWEDEVIAATHAQQAAWRLPVEVMRNDVHPFLYFLQLRLWTAISDADVWLRLNSMALNITAVASMFVVVRRMHGVAAARWAAALFALAAPVVWMSQEVRPYSWLYCLLIWAFYLTDRAATADRPRVGAWLWVALTCSAIVYSHALGSVAVLFIGVYAVLALLQRRAGWRHCAAWAAAFGACAVAAVPPLLVDALRDANLGGGRGMVSDLAEWIPRLVMPRGNSVLALWLAGLAYLAVALAGALVRATRPAALAFLVLPIALAAGLDAAHLTIFKLNIFSTIVTPFFVIATARLLLLLPPARAFAATSAFGAMLAGFSVLFLLDRPPTTGFQAASQMIRAEARPGDLVYVPQQSMFWGMARYLAPDRRDWQLAVAPVLSDQWRRMYDRLGPRFVAAFALAPQTQTLDADGLPMLIGNQSLPEAALARRVWLVTYPRADLPADFPPPRIGALSLDHTVPVSFLAVSLYD